MQNRLYLISWLALIVSVSFFVVGVLNSDWVRMEKGYYIMVILWAGFSIFFAIKFSFDREDGKQTGSAYIIGGWTSSLLAIGWGMVSVYNTTWELYLKGYFWGMTLFICFVIYVLSIEYRKREGSQPERIYQEPLSNEPLLHKVEE